MSAAFEVIAFAVSAFIAIAGALGMTTTMSMFRSGIFLMASFIGVAGLFILLAADLIGVLQVMMYIGGMLVMILFMVLVMHDPGGAMMAGMDMSLVERWFSKGLAPRKPMKGGHDSHKHDENDAGADQHEGHMHAEAHADHDRTMQHAEHGGHGGHGQEHGGMDMGGMDMSMVTPVRPAAAWLAVAIGIVLVGMLVLRPAWPVVDTLPDPDSARRVGHLLMEKYMVAFEGAGFLILIGIFGAVLLARPSIHPDDPSRSARVAVDGKPEPIADDRLIPLAGPGEQAEHQGHHRHEEHGG